MATLSPAHIPIDEILLTGGPVDPRRIPVANIIGPWRIHLRVHRGRIGMDTPVDLYKLCGDGCYRYTGTEDEETEYPE